MRRLPLVVLTGGACAALLAPARGVSDPRPVAEGVELLRAAALAADRLGYRGTEFVTYWSADRTTSALVDIAHRPGTGSLVTVAATPVNPGRVVLHREGHGDATGGVGFTAEALDLIERNFATESAGTDAVAGRLTDVVVVRERGGAIVARYWLDRATRLVLRREVLDEHGRTVHESAFVSITFGPVDIPRRFVVAEPVASGGRALDRDRLEELTRAGWRIPAIGDRLRLIGARVVEHGGDTVVQLSYSDGLSTVSLFQQRGRLDPSDLDGWSRERVGDVQVWIDDAFPRRVVWSSGGRVYTVVAECPERVLDDFVRALPHGERRRGVVGRLGRGLARVGSWFNPFA